MVRNVGSTTTQSWAQNTLHLIAFTLTGFVVLLKLFTLTESQFPYLEIKDSNNSIKNIFTRRYKKSVWGDPDDSVS